MAEKNGNKEQAEAPRHSTIRDIAARAGVAPMTVSRVINESGYVSQEMREKVQRAVKELNYHPNGLARSLKRQRTHVVGILLPDIANPFSAELKKLLALKKLPTAVFARSDFTAIGAMCAIHDAGLSIPEEIAMVGFDNVPLSAYTAPPLTTVDQPTAEQGRKAASLLLERIDGDRTRERREICLDCHLVIRQSTNNLPV